MAYNILMFKCQQCLKEKPLSEFPPAQNKIGHKKKCRECWSKYMRAYYKNKPEKYSIHKKYVQKNDIAYKKSYARHHISYDTFQKMFEKYDGKCYACQEQAATCIDHDHSCCPGSYSCGSCIRGLLCNWCNSALGHAKDNSNTLKKLIEYLDSRQ